MRESGGEGDGERVEKVKFFRVYIMVALQKELARLGMSVLAGKEKSLGVVDAITQSVVAVRVEGGRYVLAKWGEIWLA